MSPNPLLVCNTWLGILFKPCSKYRQSKPHATSPTLSTRYSTMEAILSDTIVLHCRTLFPKKSQMIMEGERAITEIILKSFDQKIPVQKLFKPTQKMKLPGPTRLLAHRTHPQWLPICRAVIRCHLLVGFRSLV